MLGKLSSGKASSGLSSSVQLRIVSYYSVTGFIIMLDRIWCVMKPVIVREI
jgi:hypothetical protein